MCGSSGIVIARQPFAATRRISATSACGSHIGGMASGMNRPGYAAHHSSMCQSLYAWSDDAARGPCRRLPGTCRAAEPGERREAHRREDAVAVHVADALVDVVRAGAHLGEADRVEAPLLLGPLDHRVQAHRAGDRCPGTPTARCRRRRSTIVGALGRAYFAGMWRSNMSAGSITWSSMLTRIMSSTCMAVLPQECVVPSPYRPPGAEPSAAATSPQTELTPRKAAAVVQSATSRPDAPTRSTAAATSSSLLARRPR